MQGVQRRGGSAPKQTRPNAAAGGGQSGPVSGLHSLTRLDQRLLDPGVGGGRSRGQRRMQAGCVSLGGGLDVGNCLRRQIVLCPGLGSALGRVKRSLRLKSETA